MAKFSKNDVYRQRVSICSHHTALVASLSACSERGRKGEVEQNHQEDGVREEAMSISGNSVAPSRSEVEQASSSSDEA